MTYGEEILAFRSCDEGDIWKTIKVLMKQNIDRELDTAYTYGNERLTIERFTGWTGYYQYDPRGSVSGITSEEGVLRASYRYDPFGGISFGSPQYNNVYAYNGEDYNPNTEFQYLRARYYDTETGAFVSEDSWLGETTNPLTLNRYTYVLNNPLNYQDPSGNMPIDTVTDIGGLAWSVYDYLKNPTAANRNAVLVDLAFVLTPYAPNPHVSKVKKAIEYLKKSKIGKKALKVVNAIGKIGKKAEEKVISLLKAIKEFVSKKTCTFTEKIKKKYNEAKNAIAKFFGGKTSGSTGSTSSSSGSQTSHSGGSNGGKNSGNKKGWKGETTKEFEKRISKLPPAERVAAVKKRAKQVAKENSLVKDSHLSKINNRDIYKNVKKGGYYSVDTQHGRFEHLNKKGKHLGEVDFDFNPTKPADKSGKHDIKIK